MDYSILSSQWPPEVGSGKPIRGCRASWVRGSSPGSLTAEPTVLLLPPGGCVWYDVPKMPSVLDSWEVILRDSAERAAGSCVSERQDYNTLSNWPDRVWIREPNCLFWWGPQIEGRQRIQASQTHWITQGLKSFRVSFYGGCKRIGIFHSMFIRHFIYLFIS